MENYVYTSLMNSNSNYETATFGQIIEEMCRELDISLVDPSRILVNSCERGLMPYLHLDTHLSEAGHKIVADLLAKELLSE